jgi:hypothetical protein
MSMTKMALISEIVCGKIDFNFRAGVIHLWSGYSGYSYIFLTLFLQFWCEMEYELELLLQASITEAR